MSVAMFLFMVQCNCYIPPMNWVIESEFDQLLDQIDEEIDDGNQ